MAGTLATSPDDGSMTGRLADATLWITSKRTTSDGRACRLMTLFADDGSSLLEALAFPWKREIVVRTAGPSGRAVLVMRRRRTFPFTGKVDIKGADGVQPLGIVTRAGRVSDIEGRVIGRFTDSRSLKRRTAESAAEALGNALMGLDSAAGGPSSADSFAFIFDGRPLGSLVRAPLPFVVPDRADQRQLLLTRLLPERWRTALARRTEPRGWRFARIDAPSHADPRLLVGAALFTVELSHW